MPVLAVIEEGRHQNVEILPLDKPLTRVVKWRQRCRYR